MRPSTTAAVVKLRERPWRVSQQQYAETLLFFCYCIVSYLGHSFGNNLNVETCVDVILDGVISSNMVTVIVRPSNGLLKGN